MPSEPSPPTLALANPALAPPDASAELEPPQRLSLALVTEGGDWSRFAAIAATIERAGVALANAPEVAVPDGSEASIVLGNDALVRRLNARYRGKDTATNVLAFPFQGPPGGPFAAHAYLGDVILAAETVLREADEQAIEPAHHLQHLVVHGLLHLLGYDHESGAAAERMERLETAVLASIGVGDPYRPTAA
ncbi:MAG TPA: rRNA maturation RNase YbeY [Hyphomicrobiaceae bacterium]|nr:rRNA maturation RNase YbeY [Hyphomicrobiaceae bacterium]